MEKYQEVLDILDDENPFLDRGSLTCKIKINSHKLNLICKRVILFVDYNSVDKNTEGGISVSLS